MFFHKSYYNKKGRTLNRLIHKYNQDVRLRCRSCERDIPRMINVVTKPYFKLVRHNQRGKFESMRSNL